MPLGLLTVLNVRKNMNRTPGQYGGLGREVGGECRSSRRTTLRPSPPRARTRPATTGAKVREQK